MKNKNMIIILFVLGAISLFTYLLPAKEEQVPTRVLLDNVYGKVVFDHKIHAEETGLACIECHHEALTDEEAQNAIACAVCHGSIPSIEQMTAQNDEILQNMTPEERRTAQNATITLSGQIVKKPLQTLPYHDTSIVTNFAACLTCHHLEFTPKDWGHDMHVEDLGLDCESCHHADKSIEPEPMNCNECHFEGMEPSLKDAVHTKCMDCHQDLFDMGIEACVDCHTPIDTKKIYKATGSINLTTTYMTCSSCHGDVEPNALVLNKMQSFHELCMGCHESMNKGPYKDDECAQCHVGK